MPATRFGGPASELFVAELDGDVVGFANVGESRDEAGEGELYTIYVDPSCWGRGVGRALMERARRRLRAPGSGRRSCGCSRERARGALLWLAPGGRSMAARRTSSREAEVVQLRYRKSLA